MTTIHQNLTIGQIAARNSCTGPWQTSLDFQINYRPDWFGFDRRLTISVLTVNFLGGLDDRQPATDLTCQQLLVGHGDLDPVLCLDEMVLAVAADVDLHPVDLAGEFVAGGSVVG